MGWSYAEISLQEMMKLIKGFVDILLLASGYQSSGFPAHWDAQDIKKALQWGIFFENVFGFLSCSDVYLDSLEELDTRLAELKSNPLFPQGLSHLSCVALSKGRAFVSEHFIRSLNLSDSHLGAFLRAVVEMDLSELREKEHDFLCVYLSKSALIDPSFNLDQKPKRDSTLSFTDIAPTMKIDKSMGVEFTQFAAREFLKRQSAVSCISNVNSVLNILSRANKCDSGNSSGNSLAEEHLLQDGSSKLMGSVDTLVDLFTWSNWKSRNLQYFLDLRIVRLVSGASMIFSAPELQWVQVLERLHTVVRSSETKLSEIIELLLLGCIASRWSCLIEHLTSISFNSIPISKQYRKLMERGSHNFYSSEEVMNSKESCILEYLTKLLRGQLHQLWKVSPALVAAAIPSRSPLYRLYFDEIETHFKEDSLRTSNCSCSRDGKVHESCDLAERIWCLYIFHICGSHLMFVGSNAEL